jgi:hypothetical protein
VLERSFGSMSYKVTPCLGTISLIYPPGLLLPYLNNAGGFLALKYAVKCGVKYLLNPSIGIYASGLLLGHFLKDKLPVGLVHQPVVEHWL